MEMLSSQYLLKKPAYLRISFIALEFPLEKTSLFTNQFYSFRVSPWIDTNSVIHSGGVNGHVLNLLELPSPMI